MKILNFGSCNIDYVYSVDHIVKAGETLSADRMDIFPGGKGLNQSIALARAGVPIYHAGVIGKDGELLRKTLEDGGVNTRFLKTAEGKSGHAIIQVDKSAENCICVFKGTNGAVTKDFVDDVLSNFDDGDFLILQNEISSTEHIIDAAKERGMTVVLNPSPINESILKLDFGKLGYLILNETEAKAISGKTDTDEFISFMREKYPKLRVVLTLGSRGCIYFSATESIRHPIFEVEAVDTTSAGDTFMGYFISMITRGESVEKALKYASCASAIAVSRKGASVSIPTFAEVEKFLPVMKVSV